MTVQWELLSNTFLWYCLLCCTRPVLTFKSVDEILKCDRSNESYWAVLSCATVYYAVKVGSNFESVNEIPPCNNSDKSSSAIIPSYGTVCFLEFSEFFIFIWPGALWSEKVKKVWRMWRTCWKWCLSNTAIFWYANYHSWKKCKCYSQASAKNQQHVCRKNTCTFYAFLTFFGNKPTPITTIISIRVCCPR